MTCQNLQNKLLNITVLFIWYLLQIVGEFKKNVTRQRGPIRHNGAKKKLQLKHKNSLFTLQTFHYNNY
jgi:hypothetical protein